MKMSYGKFFSPTNRGHFAKIWYDNEWGYSNRCVDLAIFIGNKMKDLGKSSPQRAAAKA